jgi:methionine-rich copper-binding protein CopC
MARGALWKFAVLVLASALLAPPPASAHSELRASRPAHGQRLDAAPAKLELHFNEKVQVTAVRLFDSAGKERPIERDRSLNERSIYEAPTPALEAGAYKIEWRAISADGHPVGGVIRFGIRATP